MEAASSKSSNSSDRRREKEVGLQIEGYPVEGLSIGGHETCVIFPSLKLAFDIGRCPHRAISQDFVFISHGHMDHIGGLPLYVATRGLYRMKPPTIIVPTAIKEDVERLFDIHRKMDHSELQHNLIGLDVGEEFYMRRDLKVRAFKTYHVIQSQGYVVYSIKQNLKPEYIGLHSSEIKNLKSSGIEITNTITVPEVAFTGDTMSEFIADEANDDVLRARILVVEGSPLIINWFSVGCTKSSVKIHYPISSLLSTFLNDSITVEHARDYGHIHLSEIIKYSDKLRNKAILLVHFSARYTLEEIKEALHALPSSLSDRVFALTEGF